MIGVSEVEPEAGEKEIPTVDGISAIGIIPASVSEPFVIAEELALSKLSEASSRALAEEIVGFINRNVRKSNPIQLALPRLLKFL